MRGQVTGVRSYEEMYVGEVCSETLSSLADLVRVGREWFEGYGYGLVTCLDSVRPVTLQMPSVEAAVRELNAEIRAFGNGLLMDTRSIVGAINCGFFTGYDVVWLFSHEPREEAPASAVIPYLNLDEIGKAPARNEEYQELVRWIRLSGARVGLLDGWSVQFITPERSVAELLIALSN